VGGHHFYFSAQRDSLIALLIYFKMKFMTTTDIMPEIKEKLSVPAVSSSYPTLGNAYKHGGYTVNYSQLFPAVS